MNEEIINESLRKTDFCLKKLLYKMQFVLKDIPAKQKQEIRNDLIEILKQLKETQQLLEEEQDNFSKAQLFKIGKAHGRIESLIALLGLKTR
jgi:uncharacterized membrane protein YgaE (UPF0421/DUF939 family)